MIKKNKKVFIKKNKKVFTLDMVCKTKRQKQLLLYQQRVPAYIRKMELLLDFLRVIYYPTTTKVKKYMIPSVINKMYKLFYLVKHALKGRKIYILTLFIKKMATLLTFLKRHQEEHYSRKKKKKHISRRKRYMFYKRKSKQKKYLDKRLKKVQSYIKRIKYVFQYVDKKNMAPYFSSYIRPIVLFRKQQHLQSLSVVPGDVCFVRGPKGKAAYNSLAAKAFRFVGGKLSFSQILKLYEKSMYMRSRNKTWKFVMTLEALTYLLWLKMGFCKNVLQSKNMLRHQHVILNGYNSVYKLIEPGSVINMLSPRIYINSQTIYGPLSLVGGIDLYRDYSPTFFFFRSISHRRYPTPWTSFSIPFLHRLERKEFRFYGYKIMKFFFRDLVTSYYDFEHSVSENKDIYSSMVGVIKGNHRRTRNIYNNFMGTRMSFLFYNIYYNKTKIHTIRKNLGRKMKYKKRNQRPYKKRNQRPYKKSNLSQKQKS